MTGNKTRVAVVFGGRSSEHAISCVSAGSVLSYLDQERYDVVPVGITTHGAWVLGTGDPRELVIADRALPAVDGSRHRARAARRPDPRRAGDPGPGPGRRGVLPGRRGVPGAARAVRRGRHHPGPAGDGRRALRRGRGAGQRGRHGQGVHQEAARRRRAAGRRPGRAAPRHRDADRASSATGSGCRCSSSRPGPARRSGSPGSPNGPRWTRAIAVAREHDPKVLVEAAVPGREVEVGVLEYPDGRVRPACPPRSASSAAAGCSRSSTTSRPSTSTTSASSTSRPSSTTR